MNTISVPVELHFEPIKRRDKYAILVLVQQACNGNSWEPIGYIASM